jgi:hypothetical protein
MSSRPIQNVGANRKIWGYIALGMVTLLILLATLAVGGRQQILRCDRLNTGEVDCVFKHSILGLITLDSKTIPGVLTMSIGQQCLDADCKYRLEMSTAQGVVPVTEQYTSNNNQLHSINAQFTDFFKTTGSKSVQVAVETLPILMVAVLVVFLLIWGYLGYLIWQVSHSRQEEHSGEPK